MDSLSGMTSSPSRQRSLTMTVAAPLGRERREPGHDLGTRPLRGALSHATAFVASSFEGIVRHPPCSNKANGPTLTGPISKKDLGFRVSSDTINIEYYNRGPARVEVLARGGCSCRRFAARRT
jgi:hypothetical protein